MSANQKQAPKADAERQARSERETRVLASLIDPQTAQAATATVRKYGLEERHFTNDELREAFLAFEMHGPEPFAGYVRGLPVCDLSFDGPAELERAVRRVIEDADPAKPHLDVLKTVGVVFERADQFLARNIAPPDWIIPNFIAKGMKGDLPAPSKMRKTFFTMQLAASIAAGRDFCGVFHIPEPRRVLYCNLELMEFFAQERLRTQTAGKLDGMENLTIANLRGIGHHIRDDKNATAFISAVRARDFALVILDPQYKLMEQSEDENTGQGISGILRFRDRIANETGAAVLFVCHDAKGHAGERKTTDRGAGSSWAGRDFDFRITLTPHADGDPLHVVVAGENRNRQPPPPFTAVFDEAAQTFAAAPDIEPICETAETRRAGKTKTNRAATNAADTNAFRAAALEIANRPGDMIGKTQFLEELAATKAGAIGTNARWYKLKAIIESGELKEQRELERKPSGNIGKVKNGKLFISTPARIKAYLDTFAALPL